ncbi:hypothetical protein FKG96_22335 [Olivibacter sp. LS-1]|uniref:hypothetical protein n=1 Tax=Olivibacter sp. LS-1 TaxID=2592345 RepID=UPI0011EAA254|nr:hypothetical protein [Olivibacter sp. LS-1]QEL03451.1 hypothetical protein FKG96_22335 [Olivibacter sp. LS-1]
MLEELKDYLSDKYENVTVTLLNGKAYSVTVDEDKVYWRYWLFLKRDNIIFVSYNCDEEENDKETTVLYVNHKDSDVRSTEISKIKTLEFKYDFDKDGMIDTVIYEEPLIVNSTFFLGGKRIDIDSLKDKREEEIKTTYVSQIEKSRSHLDSALNVFKNINSDKNKLLFYEAYIDFLKIKYDTSANQYQQYQDEANKLVNNLLKQNSLDTSRRYSIRDSVHVKYAYTDFYQIPKSQKTFSDRFPEFLLVTMLVLIFIYSVVNWYRYLILKRIIKLTK